MSGSLNKVMLIGHLGDDIKMHYFDGGGCVGRFSLATNETYNDKSSGEKVTNTDWHNILVRNKAAEICQKYLSLLDMDFHQDVVHLLDLDSFYLNLPNSNYIS